MERYCAEGFRALTKDSFAKNTSMFMEDALIYLEECKKENMKEKRIEDEDVEWEKYGISEEEKMEYKSRLLNEQKAYIIDIPLNGIGKGKEKELFLVHYLNWNTRMLLNSLINTKAAYWDCINEMYLALCRMTSKDEKFSAHSCFKDEDRGKKALDFFKNKRRDKTPVWKPFSKIPQKMREQADSFGIGLMRLWVYSKNFRNLFQKVYGMSNKYELDNFIACIDEGAEIIDEKIENFLILDKLASVSLIKTFYKFIYPYISDFGKSEYKCMDAFIQKVMELDGNYIRCRVLEYLGRELANIQNTDKKYRKRRMELYNLYLKDAVPHVNRQFKEFCNIKLNEIKKCFSFSAWKHYVKEEKKWMDADLEYENIYKIDCYDLESDFGESEYENKEIMKLVIKTVLDINCHKYCDSQDD